MILELLGIEDAMAEATTAASSAAAQTPQEGFLSMMPMLVIFMVVFYFLLVRPQAKRAKEGRKLMESLAVGDEIVTSGGIMAKLVKIKDSQVVISTHNGTEILMQKNAIVAILPKGTLASME